MHQKAFAGQTFDRTVHKGDLTGIEIMNRLAEAVWARGIERLEEHRALALIKSADGAAIAGVLLDRHAQRRIRPGPGPGGTAGHRRRPDDVPLPHALRRQDLRRAGAWRSRAGLPLRDMEMVQFHPTGLLAGPDTRMTGTVLEEGLRGAGGHLLNGAGRRFMTDVDARAERATRDIVSRAIYAEMRAGRTTPQRRRVPVRWPISARTTCAASSRAWSNAAPIAASTWPGAGSKWCPPRIT